MNYKLWISYNGTNYHGWNIQPNAISIQSVILDVCKQLFNIDPKINASGRTDAHVHAICQVINIKHEKLNIEPDKFMSALNSKLPRDIRINQCEYVNENFHARYNCHSKTYMYLINTHHIFDVMNHNNIYQYNKLIDINKLREAANLLIGKHNFLSYSTSELDNTIRTIDEIKIEKNEFLIKIKITANGFLRSMVRMIVGCLLAYNEQKISLDHFKFLLDNPKKGQAQFKAPGCGLYLYNVYYDEEI